MLVGIISRYLVDHRRLVIPQLGALLVKEPDHVVLFSELLKKDDGVLEQLLVDQGATTLEAAGAINRFVFEVRHELEKSSECTVEGLGKFFRVSSGAVKFEFRPSAPQEPETTDQPEDQLADQNIEPTPCEEVSKEIMDEVVKLKPCEEIPQEEILQEEEPKRIEPTQNDIPKNEPRKLPNKKIDPFKEQKRSQKHYDNLAQDPDLRGLSYSRPRVVGNNGMSSRPQQRMDKWILIAIVAAVIAVAALLYGYSLS